MSRLHEDQVDVDVALVRGLLADQHPRWADRPLEPVEPGGTDNAMVRVGDDLAARLPLKADAVPSLRKELHWLPRLAPRLSVPVPVPVAEGEPGRGYPFPWSVQRWVPGRAPGPDGLAEAPPAAVARDLGAFVRGLRGLPTEGARAEGLLASSRSGVLADRDGPVRAAVGALAVDVGVEAGEVADAWAEALALEPWAGPPVWVHADLQAGNVLVDDDGLAAVLDLGGLTVADPALDVMPAWGLLPPEVRETFRTEVEVDDPTWLRGRGWALAVGVVALAYYHGTGHPLAEISRLQVRAVLADRSGGGA